MSSALWIIPRNKTAEQMKTRAAKTRKNNKKPPVIIASQKQGDNGSAFQLKDKRTKAIAQRKLLNTINNSPRVKRLTTYQKMANNSARTKDSNSGHTDKTDLPGKLKTGIEQLSGHAMDDVKVHYNSNKPAQLQAHAYTQGNDIHIAQGQEKHLPHEAWHAVQQKQGRVKPTVQLQDGVNINDDKGLEKEADVMGAKAMGANQNTAKAPENDQGTSSETAATAQRRANNSGVVQRRVIIDNKLAIMDPENKHRFFIQNKYVNADGKRKDWINDRYNRYYDSVGEFKKHTNGAPVDVGLARKLGVWYRLPFFSGGKFFVLGENHAAFGYRELIRESNQTGKVLGEGGQNPLFHASPGKPLLETPGKTALSDEKDGAQEYMMENSAAKTTYALVEARRKNKRLKKGRGRKKSPKATLPEKMWLLRYQQVSEDQRGVYYNIPYFMYGNTRVFASTGSKAENYDLQKTVGGQFTKFIKRADKYLEDSKDKQKNGLVQENKDLMEEFLLLNENESENYDGIIGALDKLIPKMLQLARWEAKAMMGGRANTTDAKREITARAKKVQQKKFQSDDEYKEAMAARDHAMYIAILKANKKGFTMAGIGNDHAENLKGDLKSKKIPVVLHNKFVANYSIDAISPLPASYLKEATKSIGNKKADEKRLQEVALQKINDIDRVKTTVLRLVKPQKHFFYPVVEMTVKSLRQDIKTLFKNLESNFEHIFDIDLEKLKEETINDKVEEINTIYKNHLKEKLVPRMTYAIRKVRRMGNTESPENLEGLKGFAQQKESRSMWDAIGDFSDAVVGHRMLTEAREDAAEALQHIVQHFPEHLLNTIND